MKAKNNYSFYQRTKLHLKLLLVALILTQGGKAQTLLSLNLSGNQTICHNTIPNKLTANGTFSGPGSRLSIEYQKSTNNTTWQIVTTGLSSYQPGALIEKTYYRAISRTKGLKDVISNTITIDIHSELIIGQISNNQTLCYNEVPSKIIGGSLTGGTGEFSYQWKQSTNENNWTNINEAILKDYQPEKLTQTTYYKRITTNECGIKESKSVKISVYNDLASGIISSNQTISYNEVPSKIIGGSPTGGTGEFSYQWKQSTDNAKWTNVNYATESDYQSPALTETTYVKRISINECGSKESNPVKITVRTELQPGSIEYSHNICYNTTPQEIIGSTPTGGDGNYTYKWRQNVNNTRWEDISGANSINFKPSPLTKTTSFIRIVSNGNIAKESNIVTITVSDEIKAGIIGASQTIDHGKSPNKLIGAISTGGKGFYTYQWKISNDNENWNNVNEAILKDYQPEKLTQTTYYKRVTTNECGIKESNILKISVYGDLEPGVISSNQTICYDTAPKRLTGGLPSGGNGNYEYQWKRSFDDIVWTNITGATSTTFQAPALQTPVYYKREVKSGSNTKESNSIAITVLPKLSENIIVSNQTICYNTNPQVLVGSKITGGNGEYEYQWKKSSDGANWENVSNGTGINFQPESIKQTTYYKRTVITECKSVDSNEISIIVLSEFKAGSIGNNQTIIFGNVPQIISSSTAASGGFGEYTYQWQQSTDGNNWVDIMTEKSSSYQPGVLSKTTHYRRQTRDSKCGIDVTNVITITVTTENEIIGTIGTSQTICFNTSPNLLTSSNMNESEVVYKQWQQSVDGKKWNDIPGETEKTYAPPSLTNTTYYRMRVVTESNGDVVSNIVIITVLDEFNVGKISDDQSICSNNKPKPITTIIPPNHVVINRWESSINGTTWNIIANEKRDYLELPIIEKSTYYRKVVASTCGEAATSPVLITINPSLTGGTIQEGQTIDYNAIPNLIKGNMPTGGNGIYKYYWEKSYNGLDWNQIPNEIGINYQSTQLSQTTHIRRIVVSGDCNIAFSNPIVINVTSQINAGFIGSNQTICYGSVPAQILGTDAIGGIGIYNYSWEKSTDGEAWQVLFGKTDKNIVPINVITTTTYFRRQVTSGTASNHSNIVRIDVLPEVVTPKITYTDRYCKGDKININSNIDKVSWYDENMNFVSNKSILTTTANESTKYYYQIENTIGCKGDLKPVNLTVDFINTDIQINAINSRSVENGERLTITPNISSNFSADKIKYTWTFDHQQQGWYETMFDESPSQYFHWKGSYDITLVTKTPTGCMFTSKSLSTFFINEETEDTRTKSAHIGTKKYLDSNFGLNKDVSINLYPSLFDAVLIVELNNIDSKATLYLHDASGRIVLTKAIEEGSNLISTDTLAKGIYIVRITSKNDATIFNAKVIKQ